MTLSTNPPRGCMKFEAPRKLRSQKTSVQRASCKKSEKKACGKLTRKQFAKLLFEGCVDCKKMSAIPQGAFAARKVRQARESNWMIMEMESKNKGNAKGNGNQYNTKPTNQGMELTPLKYNSKLMNSIWGLYNRYSVHNFKKNSDASIGVFAAVWGAASPTAPPRNRRQHP